MRTLRLALPLFAALSVGGCQTSTGSGALGGAALGGLLGSFGGNAGWGALIGAGAGAGAGYHYDQSQRAQQQRTNYQGRYDNRRGGGGYPGYRDSPRYY